MTPAKQDGVVKTRLAAVGPVHDMVAIDKTGVHTARKAAALVPPLQGTVDGRRYDTGFAADIERFTVFGFEDRDHGTVTGEAADGFSR
jgi:hypothetical protein